MANDLQNPSLNDAMEQNAYNAAFHELGFRWHWDDATYEQLQRRGSNDAERIGHYLETRQPHLLKAYDAAFLVDAIQQKKASHEKCAATSGAMPPTHFNWAETLGCEIGA